MHHLILASGSRYRRELLSRLGLKFSTCAPNIDESPKPGEKTTDIVVRLAQTKARSIQTEHPHAIVIGCDQLAMADEREPIGKPKTMEEAIQTLTRLSGRTLSFVTGVATYIPGLSSPLVHLDTTNVRLRRYGEDEIARYARNENVLDCAAGLKIESGGITLVDSVETRDPTALIGLPLIAVCQHLRRAGFSLP